MMERKWYKVFLILGSEILFIFLPFMVIVIVLWHQSKLEHFMYAYEISLASTLLIGQGLVRYITGILKVHGEHHKIIYETPAFILSLALVLGLIPASIVLVLVFLSKEPSTGLALAQFALFIWSFILYLILAGFGEMLAKDISTTPRNVKSEQDRLCCINQQHSD